VPGSISASWGTPREPRGAWARPSISPDSGTTAGALELAEVSGSEAEAALRASEIAPDAYTAAWIGTLRSWHQARTRTELGRAALAVAARSAAPLPLDPYSDSPFVRESRPNGERISSPAAIQALGDPGQPQLLSWSLPR
jgi:hypothetical protein